MQHYSNKKTQIMKKDILKCEECVWFKIRVFSFPKYGIPMWEMFECAKHKYQPHIARIYEGLCGASGKDYMKKSEIKS